MLVLVPGVAHAGNDDEVFLGNQAPLSGGAVTATVNDGAALVYEPSGLVEGSDQTIDVSVTALSLRVHRAEDVLSTMPGSGNDARFVEFVSIPSTLAYTRTLSSRTRVGLGLFATRGSALRLRESLDVAGDGERSAYQFATTQRGSAIVLTAGLGHRITDAWRFGVAVAVVYDSDDINTQLSGARYVTEGDEERNTDSMTVQNMASYSRFGVRATAGVRFVPNDRFRIAIALTSPGLAVAGIVSIASSTALFSSRPAVPVGGHVQEDVSRVSFRAGVFSPLHATLGLGVSAGRTSVAIDADVRAPVHDDAYGVRRDAVFNVRAGVRHALSDTVALGAGLFTDRSSFTPTNTSANGSDDERDFYGMTFGVERLKVRRLADTESARELHFVSVYGFRYALGVGHTDGLRVEPSFDASMLDTLTPNRIRAVTHELSLYIGSSLRF